MNLPLKKFFPNVSSIALGCMGFGGGWDQEPVSSTHIDVMNKAIDASLESGINLFDHADIYTRGKAEETFGQVLQSRPELKQHIIIQSKCGIRFEEGDTPGRYDFSADWIRHSVEGSLTRLGLEQLDILLLHRPDPLMEPEEVAQVFDDLQQAGKVKHFGVSNMHGPQVDFLQRHLNQPLIVNQMEMSLSNLDWLNEGVTAGMSSGQKQHFSPGIMEYSRLNHVQLQAWGCLAKGLYTGRDISNESEAVKHTSTLISKLAAEYQVSQEAIALAWLRRHPAGIQPIIGTTNPNRIKACTQATDVTLTREHWYSLFVTSRGQRLP